MSDRLAISAAFSVLMMVVFVLSGTQPAASPFSDDGTSNALIAASEPITWSVPSVLNLLR